ncbi:hypothetical protein P280DRAFT_515589 [Massarina eburnea CBS 473.64]|uniref:Uncharacterized protein n=1 Tax=Massarina eburnea CBS 473.64 TaxID=1395130 RepID=A0A6A6S6A8_9PLEO|nr:hypothetical protein P280DRAFT_515589 [Massarina eburnea CBS 473.64]
MLFLKSIFRRPSSRSHKKTTPEPTSDSNHKPEPSTPANISTAAVVSPKRETHTSPNHPHARNVTNQTHRHKRTCTRDHKYKHKRKSSSTPKTASTRPPNIHVIATLPDKPLQGTPLANEQEMLRKEIQDLSQEMQAHKQKTRDLECRIEGLEKRATEAREREILDEAAREVGRMEEGLRMWKEAVWKGNVENKSVDGNGKDE